MSSFGGDDIDAVIMEGITFRGRAGKSQPRDDGKVKTKAKKKADIRQRRANRHKK